MIKMAVDKGFLEDNEIGESLTKRLTAQFKGEIPEPPTEMLGYRHEGSYHALAEFYAVKLLTAQGHYPSVAKVRGLTGGKMDRVNSNVKDLRSELIPKVFEPYSFDEPDDPMAELKKRLILDAQDRLNVELDELEQAKVKEIITLEKQHDKAMAAAEAALNKQIGRNGEIADILKMEQGKNIELSAGLLKQKGYMTELNGLRAFSANQEVMVNEIKASNATMKSQYDHFSDHSNTRLTELKGDKGRLESQVAVLQKKHDDQKEFVDSYLKERESLSASISKLNTELKQRELKLAVDESTSQLISEIKNHIKPLDQAQALVQSMTKATNTDKGVLNEILKIVKVISANGR
jgi:hypothetical protein